MPSGVKRILPVAALILVSLAVTVWLVAGVGIVTPERRPLYNAGQGVLWTLFAAAVVLLLRVPRRAVAALVLGGALALGGAGLSDQPTTSTDSARYAWDGIVQSAGISPYADVPADERLAALRPEWLFPTPGRTASGAVTCPGERALPVQEVGADGPTGRVLCTAINRPLVPTIYPPVAEALFTAARIAVPREAGYLPMQVLGLVVLLATTALLLRILGSRGRDPRWAAVWGWCPFVVSEAVTNAHVDGAAALLALAATALAVRGRTWRAGAVIGLAFATKFLPVLVAPALVRRRPAALVLGAVGAVVAVYLPHLLTAGAQVIGYLPGYLQEEGYDGGSRSVLLSAVLPEAWTTPVAALLLAAVVVAVVLRADPTDPWAAQAATIGAALLLASPRYGWYALLLLPFAIAAERWEWLPLVVALQLDKVGLDLWQQRSVLLVALATALLAAAVRRALRRRDPGFLRAA